MILEDLLKRITEFRQDPNVPTIVGIRHQIGLLGERFWIDETISYLQKRAGRGDKVMLEGCGPNEGFPSRVKNFFSELESYLESKYCEIIYADEKSTQNDGSYWKEGVRDEIFAKKLQDLKPRFFLVGYDHLEFLRSRLPSYNFVNLVNERKDKKRCSWLTVRPYDIFKYDFDKMKL